MVYNTQLYRHAEVNAFHKHFEKCCPFFPPFLSFRMPVSYNLFHANYIFTHLKTSICYVMCHANIQGKAWMQDALQMLSLRGDTTGTNICHVPEATSTCQAVWAALSAGLGGRVSAGSSAQSRYVIVLLIKNCVTYKEERIHICRRESHCRDGLKVYRLLG